MSAPRKTVRLLYQMATAKQNTELGQKEVDRRLAYCRDQLGPETQVDIATPASGPGAIESRVDAAVSVPYILEGALRAERDGYDAVVISCFSDPGLEACRELVSIPVTASAQAAMHLAAQLGTRFTVIAPGTGRSSRSADSPHRYGLTRHYAGTRRSGLSVMDLARDRERTLARLADIGVAAVSEDGADVLVLGCMSMAFHGIEAELQDRIGVPVINPVPASLMLAELMVRCRVSQSPLAYPRVAPPDILHARVDGG